MLKIENVHVDNIVRAVYAARNAKNSWSRSDSLSFPNDTLGPNDIQLAKTLANAGSDHGKFLRMINVTCDIVAPLYVWAEIDTYKVGTVRNSCSFMHKGVSKSFEINDFSVQDERIYYLLNSIETKSYELIYPYETDEFRIYELNNGRKYKVFRNGKVVSCEFTYTDNYGTGRTRTFEEREVKPSVTKHGGYYELNLGGRNGEKWLLHRLVATVWRDNPNNYKTVNHINGNKGDNSVENLEWCSLADNIRDGYDKGLYDKNKLHLSYNSWKNGHYVVSPLTKSKIKYDYKQGLSRAELSEKYNLTQKTVDNILYIKPCENEELFTDTFMWEKVIEHLNQLRELYLETKDESIFFAIRQFLPQGYMVRATWQANYAVLRNIYHARKNHRLSEWHEFCAWIETLPYAKELIIGE